MTRVRRMLPQLLLDLFDDLVGTGAGRSGVPISPAATPAPRADEARPSRPTSPLADDAFESPAAPCRPLSSRPLTRTRWLAQTRTRLAQRFAALSLTSLGEIRTHANLRTMVSASEGVVRLHGGYADAPDRVLIAIAKFLERRTTRAVRLQARRVLLEFPVLEHVPAHLRGAAQERRQERAVEQARPGDAKLLTLLRERHALLNMRHFDGQLSEIPLVISGRMRRKLGHVALESGRATELAMSRRHMMRDPEAAWMETLLHEMVHQWQAETGRPVDHGAEFRRKAISLGITPRAVRPA